MNTHTYLVSVTGSTNMGGKFDACFQYSTASKGSKLAEELVDVSNNQDYGFGYGVKANPPIITGVFDCGKNEE